MRAISRVVVLASLLAAATAVGANRGRGWRNLRLELRRNSKWLLSSPVGTLSQIAEAQAESAGLPEGGASNARRWTISSGGRTFGMAW
jgi:hypothetical protein